MAIINNLNSISFSEAKAIAEKNALLDLDNYAMNSSSALRCEFMEAECCWMFFRNEDIDVPLEHTLGLKWAYVVSKKGAYCMVQDLSENHEALLEYLKKLSTYFKARNI